MVIELKQTNSRFSYRYFNRLAGIQSSAFLKLVMEGKRNLAEEGTHKIIRGLKLKTEEGQYFATLVKFNQAKTNEQRDRYFRELASSKQFLRAKPLTHSQYELFSHWYHVAILELIRIPTSAPKDLDWVAHHLHPRVERKAIKEAMKTLRQLELIEEDPQVGLKRKEVMLKTDDEVQSLFLTNFHTEMSQMAIRAVQEDPAESREFSALTILSSEKGMALAKAEIQNFRKQLHSLLEQVEDETKDRVLHLNLQLFALSTTQGDKP